MTGDDVPTRRKLLLSGAGLAVAGAGVSLFLENHSLPAADPVAERHFRDLQDAVLARYGVPSASRLFDIPNPQLRVHVIEAGHGEPVIFLHGGNSVAASWTPLLAKLHERFHLYAPDRPGCGLTAKFLYTGVALRAHATAFVGAVMDQLQLPRAAIVGNSMGGYFSLAYALAHPERVSKLVLIGEPAGSAPEIRMLNRLIGTRGVNSALFETVLKPGPATIRSSFANLLVADVRRVPQDLMGCLLAGSMIPGATQSWITLNENVYSLRGAGLFSRASTLTYALRPELHNLAAPTLLLWGEKDTFGPPMLGQEMARLMPNGRCEVIPDAGHLAWMDQLDICAEKVSTFLSRSQA